MRQGQFLQIPKKFFSSVPQKNLVVMLKQIAHDNCFIKPKPAHKYSMFWQIQPPLHIIPIGTAGLENVRDLI
jgi:hypothetical protein